MGLRKLPHFQGPDMANATDPSYSVVEPGLEASLLGAQEFTPGGRAPGQLCSIARTFFLLSQLPDLSPTHSFLFSQILKKLFHVLAPSLD